MAGGHSIDDPEPKYGMAVTGAADPGALLRIDAGQPGLPLSLTKPTPKLGARDYLGKVERFHQTLRRELLDEGGDVR